MYGEEDVDRYTYNRKNNTGVANEDHQRSKKIRTRVVVHKVDKAQEYLQMIAVKLFEWCHNKSPTPQGSLPEKSKYVSLWENTIAEAADNQGLMSKGMHVPYAQAHLLPGFVYEEQGILGCQDFGANITGRDAQHSSLFTAYAYKYHQKQYTVYKNLIQPIH